MRRELGNQGDWQTLVYQEKKQKKKHRKTEGHTEQMKQSKKIRREARDITGREERKTEDQYVA